MPAFAKNDYLLEVNTHVFQLVVTQSVPLRIRQLALVELLNRDPQCPCCTWRSTFDRRSNRTNYAQEACHSQHASLSRTTQYRLPVERECPPMKTNPNGSEATYLFEMQRWMPRILSQERIGFVRQSLHVLGELAVEKPETWCCPVSQKSVQRPSRKSCNASSPSRSSRPEATSVSSC